MFGRKTLKEIRDIVRDMHVRLDVMEERIKNIEGIEKKIEKIDYSTDIDYMKKRIEGIELYMMKNNINDGNRFAREPEQYRKDPEIERPKKPANDNPRRKQNSQQIIQSVKKELLKTNESYKTSAYISNNKESIHAHVHIEGIRLEDRKYRVKADTPNLIIEKPDQRIKGRLNGFKRPTRIASDNTYFALSEKDIKSRIMNGDFEVRVENDTLKNISRITILNCMLPF